MSDNEITIEVDAKNNTGAAFGAAAKGAKTVGEAAELSGKRMKDAGDKAEVASLKVRMLAERQSDAARKAFDLALRLKAAQQAAKDEGDTSEKTALKISKLASAHDRAALAARTYAAQGRTAARQAGELGRAYDRTADQARQAARAVAMLGAASVLVGAGGGGRGGFGGGGKDGGGFWSGLAENAGDAATKPFGAAGMLGNLASNPYGAAAGMAGFIAGAPFILGAAGGAALAGGGAGLAAAGAAGAYQNDPEAFQRKWGSIIEPLKARWMASTKSWIQPAMGALDEFDGMLKSLPIEDVFKGTSGYLTSLAKGGAGFGSEMGMGFGAFLKDAKPVIDMLETRLPKLGKNFGDMFRAIGMGSEGGAEALDDLLGAVGEIAEGFGKVILGAEVIYKSFKDISRGAKELESSIPGLDRFAASRAALLDKLVPGGEAITQTGRVLRDTGDAADNAAQSFAGLEYAAASVRNELAKGKNAALDLAQGWLDFSKELKEGKKTLDMNTQAGVNNQRAFVDQIMTAERARQQQIALTGDVAAANATYDQNIARIRAMAIAAGFNAQQVDALIREISGIPESAQTVFNMHGLNEALQKSSALVSRLDDIAGVYTAYVRVHSTRIPDAPSRAAGGPTSPGLTRINDWGGQAAGEVVRLPAGSMVYGGAKARGGDGASAAAPGAAGGTGGAQRIELALSSDGGAAADLIVDLLAKGVRVRGGNVQVAVTGRAT